MRINNLKLNWKIYAVALLCAISAAYIPEQYVTKVIIVLGVLIFGLGVISVSPQPLVTVSALFGLTLIPMSLLGIPIAELTIILALSFIVLVLPIIERSQPAVQRSWGLILAFVLMGLGFLITRVSFVLMSKSPYSNMGDIQIWSTLLTVPLVAYLVGARILSWKSIVFGLTSASTVLVVWCFINSLIEGDLLRDRFGFAGNINPNVLASFLDITCGLALYCGMDAKNPRKRLFLLMGGIQFIALILTQTRGSVMGMAVLCCCLLWRARKSKTAILGAVLLAPVVVALGVGKTISRITSPSMNDLASNYGRIKLLESTWVVMNENNYIAGSGMDNFKKEKMKTGFPAWFDQEGMMSSHNAHLEFILGWGVFGFLGWLMMLGAAIREGIRFSIESGNPSGVGIAIGLISFALHGLVESLIASPPFFLTLCIIMGVAFGVSKSGLPANGERGESVANKPV